MSNNKCANLFLILLISSISAAFSQKQLLPGELVTSDGTLLQGEINYEARKETPTSFEFRHQNGTVTTYTAENAQSLTIYLDDDVKEVFTSFNLEIDFGSMDLKKLDTKAEPTLTNKTVFVRNLVNGTIELYGLIDASDKSHYFVSKGASPPKELTYRKYYYSTNPDGTVSSITTSTGVAQVKTNEGYKNELYNLMKDNSTFVAKDFEKLEFKQKALINIVDKYNNGSTYVAATETMKFRPEISAVAAIVNTKDGTFNKDIPSSFSPSLGIGLYAKIPRTSWALQNNLRFTSINAEASNRTAANADNYEITTYQFSYIKLHTMFRYIHPLNSGTEIYFQGGMLNGFLVKEKVLTQRHFYTSDTETLADQSDKKMERGIVVGAGLGKKNIYLGLDYEISNGFRFSVFNPIFTTLYFTGTYRF
ncbi:outer membrane beta-barrel protein [Imperialibacter roseus]|uniref:Outer membrane beta-barrel protein n=1 Tax=Imperialibacter roseus TaxID=1324217 RepID=A0ABZ0IQV8_9BACT|nr:outer membrane beta-barrel protein [Imperialibacter roseus]WOK07384.1 outer membrane beta-barrel protein [Imperialibacter roseus]